MFGFVTCTRLSVFLNVCLRRMSGGISLAEGNDCREVRREKLSAQKRWGCMKTAPLNSIIVFAVASLLVSGCAGLQERSAARYAQKRGACQAGDQAACIELAGLIQRCENTKTRGAIISSAPHFYSSTGAALGAAIGDAISEGIAEADACGGQPGYEVAGQASLAPATQIAPAPVATGSEMPVAHQSATGPQAVARNASAPTGDAVAEPKYTLGGSSDADF
jgi:hypothetical protein